MDLYFSPLACSMASRISLYEANASARFIEVDAKTKRTLDGDDFLAINPIGLVPALRTDSGDVLTENAAILQFIADRYPEANIAPSPTSGMPRSRLHQWLCFIGTELHKALFVPLFDKQMTEDTKARTLERGDVRLAFLNDYLSNREFLLDRFSIADAYLFTVLNWRIATPVDVKKWRDVDAYYSRIQQRPSVKRALEEEFALYAQEKQRNKAA